MHNHKQVICPSMAGLSMLTTLIPKFFVGIRVMVEQATCPTCWLEVR